MLTIARYVPTTNLHDRDDSGSAPSLLPWRRVYSDDGGVDDDDGDASGGPLPAALLASIDRRRRQGRIVDGER